MARDACDGHAGAASSDVPEWLRGVGVYGYSSAVSYMFAGGLDLKQIVIN